ncbi:hypothetical protein, variant [Allomyces macrogynus ATCC 38327]|uniref:Uncharacterized protein n=1 Tax=Allomyces macrogynus (strain ATCC 38327) TaxID=578462 RepID=A0A0L0S660_ALLM3|nr:hypothetical protein, variant [Allomyces macrogynus ATCC 38327]|eukprot:KNE57935.1 hypothetical protein, variant [Allomyces macrogynus ATCC 38327]
MATQPTATGTLVTSMMATSTSTTSTAATTMAAAAASAISGATSTTSTSACAEQGNLVMAHLANNISLMNMQLFANLWSAKNFSMILMRKEMLAFYFLHVPFIYCSCNE